MFIISSNSFSQTTFRFNKTYDINSSDFLSFIKPFKSGYIGMGTSTNPYSNANNVALIYIDSIGNKIWHKTYAGFDGNYPTNYSDSFVFTTDSGFATACTYSNLASTYSGIYLMKFDKNGDSLWTKYYIDTLNIGWGTLARTYDNGFILSGTIKSPNKSTYDNLIIKVDSMGNKKWQKIFGGAYNDEPRAIRCLSDSGFILAGNKQTSSSSYNYGQIIKLDSLGNIKWQKTFGGTRGSFFNAVRETKNGDIIACGDISDIGTSTWDYSTPFIVRLSSSGNILWQKTYGKKYIANSLYDIEETDNGNLIAVGDIYTDTATQYEKYWDGFLLKTNINGDSLWSRTFDKTGSSGGNLQDMFQDVEQTKDKGFIIAGWFYPNYQDFWAVKVDSMGCDIGGCDTITSVRNILNGNNANSEFKIYPNPAKEKITIEFSNDYKFSNALVNIYDVSGRVLKTLNNIQLNNRKSEIDISDLESGIYFVEFFDKETKKKYTKKLVVHY